MTDIALRITAPELKQLVAFSEHSCAIGRGLRDQLRELLRDTENRSVMDVSLVSKTAYPVIFAIDRGYVRTALQEHDVDPTDGNVRTLADEVESRTENGSIDEAKKAMHAIIREYLDYGKFTPSTKSTLNKILKITNSLDAQIKKLESIVENPEQYGKEQYEDASERLLAARSTYRHWRDLHRAPLDEKGCLADKLEAIPVRTPLHKAYAIYLKTYKTEV